MADIVTLGDVSTKDAGSGSQLKTGGRRKHNMPKECVEQKMKQGMSRGAAMKACYPVKPGLKKWMGERKFKEDWKKGKHKVKDVKISKTSRQTKKGY